MFNIIPFLLIVIPLVLAIIIVVRKFPQLVLLDVESLPEVKEEKRKDTYLRKRAEIKTQKQKKERRETVNKCMAMFEKAQESFRIFVGGVQKQLVKQKQGGAVKRKTEKSAVSKKTVQGQDVSSMLDRAHAAFVGEKIDQAEELFISVIRQDNKNIDGYKGLVDVYIKQGQWKEAAQTSKFLIKLSPKGVHYVKLAKIEEHVGNIEKAIILYRKAVKKKPNRAGWHSHLARLLEKVSEYDLALKSAQDALAIEPENPRFLDNVLEFAIILENKKLAQEILRRVRKVNPENDKISRWRDRIQQMRKK
tara:strand:- start:527 stop:1444 length:918 start_codon:yes stop_codon:yes gene_type:complete